MPAMGSALSNPELPAANNYNTHLNNRVSLVPPVAGMDAIHTPPKVEDKPCILQEEESKITQPMIEAIDFRSVPIVPPTVDDLLILPRSLASVKVDKCIYTSVTEYLATYYFLLHEDCFGPIREGVVALRSGSNAEQSYMRVYTDAKLKDICFTKKGTSYKVTFSLDQSAHKFEQQSDFLKFGSLLCISSNSFKTLIWATVTSNNIQRLGGGKNAVELICLGDSVDESARLQYGVTYTMAESSSSYFEPYVHSLRNLRRAEMAALPFAEHLVSLVSAVAPPSYITRRHNGDVYNLQSVFSDGLVNGISCMVNIFEEWPEMESSLDSSQIDAVKHGLTKRLAVIQGPPGTGKTFVGLVITKILLANLRMPILVETITSRFPISSELRKGAIPPAIASSGPILVVCFTNHALDQFLEGIYKYEQRLVRYGGRCKSPVLESCLMRNLRQSMNRRHPSKGKVSRQEDRVLKYQLFELRMRLKNVKKLLALEIISKREHLVLVASSDLQVDNLLLLGDERSSQNVIQMWLQGLSSPAAEAGVLEEERDADQSEEAIADMLLELDLHEEDLPLDKLQSEPYPWTLSRSSRCTLHQYWLESLRKLAREQLGKLTTEFENICHQNVAPYDDNDLAILKQARLVGMTTSAAARNWELLVELKPEIVIAEEAAEVLEAHIVACLTPYTKHLILIGDHMQLRPSVSNHKLSVKKKLDVSMFERLVTGQVEHKTLNVQRRMRPCISRLLKRFYPELTDHQSVSLFDNVRGLQKNVFFWDHNAVEVSAGSTSKSNPEEAKMAVEIACYLTEHQGYKNSEVTILTLYSGQRDLIKRLLGIRPAHAHRDATEFTQMRVTSVDDFQGEESEIVLLSLVRNNKSTLGFSGNPNRICVALSRARQGLFILGNAALFQAKSSLWDSIIQDLSSNGSIGPELLLSCPNHPGNSNRTASCAADIRGFPCTLPCSFILSCSHLCPLPCHYMGDHDTLRMACKQSCGAVHTTCNHACAQDCHLHTKDTGCPPCNKRVPVHLSTCGHQIYVPCHQLESGRDDIFTCIEACPFGLPCGHSCQNRCGKPCTTICEARVSIQLPCQHHQYVTCGKSSTAVLSPCMEKCTKELACGHRTLVSCSEPVSSVSCVEKISEELPCGHLRKVSCGNKETVSCSTLVMKTLPCGHNEEVLCSQQERLYSIRCSQKIDANLPCGHKASIQCHQRNSGKQPPCLSPCPQRLQCGHICSGTCSICHAGQHAAICKQSCAKPLPCLHACKAKCGEPCKPCQKKTPCLHRCVHARCSLNCSMPCVPCLMPCPWKCEHYSCSLSCNEVCIRPRCNITCAKSLACGHPCIGLCGEPCPTKCRTCHPNTLELFTRERIGKMPASTSFVQLVDCGHICEVGRLDMYMDRPNQYKSCPRCKFPISERTLRYGSIMKALHLQAQDRKKSLIQAQPTSSTHRILISTRKSTRT